MPTIKLTAEGKVITKGGLPSCTCCGGCATNCDGPWGLGYDSLPETVEVRFVFPFEGLASTFTRIGKCAWQANEGAAYGMLQYCVDWQITSAFTFTVSRPAEFVDGPTGFYYGYYFDDVTGETTLVSIVAVE
jgi:hypothetical protein